MIIVSDTSPICYLLLIDQINILPKLYGLVTIPQAVFDELQALEAPEVVRNWLAKPPEWLQIQAVSIYANLELQRLDPGEREAILLAEQLNAGLIILDDKAARQMARARGLKVIGLLGILKDATKAGMLNDVRTNLERLREVGFWVAPSLLEQILKEM